jgi:hypothetical protein
MRNLFFNLLTTIQRKEENKNKVSKISWKELRKDKFSFVLITLNILTNYK